MIKISLINKEIFELGSYSNQEIKNVNKKRYWIKVVIVILIVILLLSYKYESKSEEIFSFFITTYPKIAIKKIPTLNAVIATPTFPPPSDPFYDNIVDQIIEQKDRWEDELGWETSRKKTVDWLNGNLSDIPLPDEISNAIESAELGDYTIRIIFKNGYVFNLLEGTKAAFYAKRKYKIIIFFTLLTLLFIIIFFLTKRFKLLKEE